jgi:sialate O-acetylesterase
MKIYPAGDEASALSLAGPWRLRETVALTQATPLPPNIYNAGDPSVFTVLYNGMIAPLQPAAIKGAIWYQGESNCGNAWQYRTLLPLMIKDWRRGFACDFGFHIVSLANLSNPPGSPSSQGNDWAEVREAQALAARTVPNCGLAITIDIGDPNDIHPKNKQEVGRRLALSARAITYGEHNLEWSGPWFKNARFDEGKAVITFSHLGGGLAAKGGKPVGFALAGEDQRFVWGDAVIAGDTVVVSSSQVPKPVAVRYAWEMGPACNLYSKLGLPAVPFRTDDWPACTRDRR